MRPLLIAFGVMSLISLAVYGADKARAQSRRWRIPESCLLLLGFLGGAAGALWACSSSGTKRAGGTSGR